MKEQHYAVYVDALKERDSQPGDSHLRVRKSLSEASVSYLLTCSLPLAVHVCVCVCVL